MDDLLEKILQSLIDFNRRGKGIDKGFSALILFLALIAFSILMLPIEPESKAWFLIFTSILLVFAFDIYAKHRGKNTIEKESREDLEEGRITTKTYERIVHEK